MSRHALVRSAPAIQEHVGRLEVDATLIRSRQPEIPPGIRQSLDWTTAMIAGDGGADPGLEWRAARARQRSCTGLSLGMLPSLRSQVIATRLVPRPADRRVTVTSRRVSCATQTSGKNLEKISWVGG